MAQAPGYNPSEVERERVEPTSDRMVYERERVPVGSAGFTGTTGPGTARMAGSRFNFIQWGPVWAGFFTILIVMLILGSLGVAIAGGGYGFGHAPTTFSYGWAIGTGVIAYFLGGLVAARAAGVTGLWTGLLLGAMTWALSLIAFLIVLVAGAGDVASLLSGNLFLIPRSGVGSAGAAGIGAWALFASLIISFLLAVFGGMVGIRGMPRDLRIGTHR